MPTEPIYTAGDFTLEQIGPSMFTVTTEQGACVYFVSRDLAERRGRELAQVNRVSFWRAGADTPLSLIATYRQS